MKTVSAAIIQVNDSVLIAKRAPGESLEGFWEFPGGKLKDNESIQECLERELFEEFGVQAVAKHVFAESVYEYVNGTIRLIGVYADLLSNAIELSVHDEVIWAPIEKLLSFNLAPADIPLAKKLQEDHNEI